MKTNPSKKTIIFDIGNSNITAGVFDGASGRLLFNFRLRTNINYTEDQHYTHVQQLLSINGVNRNDICGAFVGSVVPAVTPAFTAMLVKYFGIKPLTMKPGIKMNVRNLYRNKTEVGDDRLANACAAAKYFPKKDVIVIDLGTSINFDAVSRKAEFLGGAIMPGINMSLRALFERTAKLPQINLQYEKKGIGKTTEESISSGVLNGIIGGINRAVAMIKKDMKAKKVTLVFTGGEAHPYILDSMEEDLIVKDRDFTLKGFKIIHDMNKKCGHGQGK